MHQSGYEFGIKWLIEGAAASFESLYIQQFYNNNYFLDAQTNVNNIVHSNPSELESYDSYEEDCCSSVFLTLVLAKELIKSGYSEEEAFRLIYKQLMLQKPTNQTWKTHFESVFNFTVDNFYDSVKTYTIDINSVLPSQNLKLEDIF